MTWIKICGMTNLDDALKAASLGVDALGFIFASSPRRVKPEVVKKIILALSKTLLKVGVFVDEEPKEVLQIAEYCNLNALQFHGRESPEYCRRFVYPIFKAIHVKDIESLEDMGTYRDVSIILDTYNPSQAGGTGRSFPWGIAITAKEKRNFILSGGLTPSNVGEAVRRVRPWGVDVCSGVETVPGKKDHLKISEFIREVRQADEKTG